MDSTVLHMTIASLLLVSSVCGQKERSLRFPNTQKHVLEKSYLKGVFDERKYFPYKRADREKVKSLPEVETDLAVLADNLSWRRVDLVTGEQLYLELSPEDVKNVLDLGLRLGTEQAVEQVVEGDSCQGSECEPPESKARRLFIFPPDNRYEITTANWSPPRHAGLLEFSGGWCSGTLIGPRHVLTAGHCVHEGDGGDWYSNFRFYPGRTRTNTPTSFTGVASWSLVGWTQHGDISYDIGMVQLSKETGLGWVSFGYHNGLSESWNMYSKGYPGDKPYGSQWSTSGYPSDVNGLDIEFDTLDALPGQSGSPIYYYQNGNPVIYGVWFGEVWWEFLWWSDEWNQFTRITSGRFSSMCDWINDDRLGC